jgi:hypothetical protein
VRADEPLTMFKKLLVTAERVQLARRRDQVLTTKRATFHGTLDADIGRAPSKKLGFHLFLGTAHQKESENVAIFGQQRCPETNVEVFNREFSSSKRTDSARFFGVIKIGPVGQWRIRKQDAIVVP